MRFPQQFLDELKARLRPSDVIGKTVKLRRQGREYAGLSPFAKEKTPSFFVNDDKGFFHCFASGKHGDIINFLQETERLSFTEAVERLAGEAGMALPARSLEHAAQDRQRLALTELLEQAAAWFEAQLRRPIGEGARAYLQKRAIPPEVWGDYRLGYAPSDRTALKDHLITKGAMPDDLVRAGLIAVPAAGGAPVDFFNDRIIFPILDGRGRLVSFAGRALSPKARAKYLNGPETPVFSKGRHLYGAPKARVLLAQGHGPACIVEGYFDVIACQRANIPAVAPMGTALTADQVAAAWRLDPEPVLCFDGDAAGARAASRALDLALPLIGPGRSFRFAQLGAKDADEIYRVHGAAVLKQQVALSTPFVEALFRREKDAVVLDTPEARAGLAKRLRGLASSISDQDLSQAYAEDLKARLDALLGRGKPPAARSVAATPLKALRDAARDRLNPFHAAVAVAAIDNPTWAKPYDEPLARLGFIDGRLNPLADILVSAWTADAADPDSITDRVDQAGQGALLDAARHDAEGAGVPFLDPSIAMSTRRSIWASAYETLIELGDAQLALEALRQGTVTEVTLATTREIRQRATLLERRISALDFAGRDDAVG